MKLYPSLFINTWDGDSHTSEGHSRLSSRSVGGVSCLPGEQVAFYMDGLFDSPETLPPYPVVWVM